MLRMRLLFYHSTKRINRKGKAPIYSRITISGHRADFSTGIFVEPQAFSCEQITANSVEADHQNAQLTRIKNKAFEIYYEHKNKGQPISAVTLKNIITGECEAHKLFSEVCNEYLSEFETKGFEHCTVVKNFYFLNNITEFLNKTKRQKILLDEFRIGVAEEFRTWLLTNIKSTDRKLPASQDHINRHLKFCKRVFRFALKREYIKFNLLEALEAPRGKRKEVIALSAEEFLKLKNHSFSCSIYKIVQANYLFQCGSGLSYCDLWTFEVCTLKDGREWIVQRRGKNDQVYQVELSGTCRKILNEYKGALPFITNQAYNRIIKEIAQILGITKRLTTHTARKTFANIKYFEGYSIPAIGFMLGHRNTKTTETDYLSPGIDRIINERTAIESKKAS